MGRLPASGRDAVHVWVGRYAGGRPASARGLLRHAGGALLGRPTREVEVGWEPDGRPYARVGGAVLPVSVSHGDGVLVVAARRAGPVGVDVERLRPLPAPALAGRWYAPTEVDWLRGRPADRRDEAFLLLWTAKEAVGKALGRGLRDGGLRRVMPAPAPGSPLRALPDEPRIRVGHPPAGTALVLAVAVLDAAGEVEVLLHRAPLAQWAGHGAAARRAVTERTSLPVVVRGSRSSRYRLRGRL
ncbi:4'-phosphopantetheinyl transferase family protein [Micromonospora sp. NPDC000089]|uniref:4'-phosphopantetheinyl transferase family protein n=1 Tax=unclassified Micromonospora TaxID=2617518 RepID=UPI00367451BE